MTFRMYKNKKYKAFIAQNSFKIKGRGIVYTGIPKHIFSIGEKIVVVYKDNEIFDEIIGIESHCLAGIDRTKTRIKEPTGLLFKEKQVDK